MTSEDRPVEIGVVVPLYQMAHVIERTLATVFAQHHAPHQVVVVDDGSRDGGAERAAAAFGDAIEVVSQENAGQSTARNRGVEVLRTPWVAFLDADDHWFPDHLATLVAAVRAFPEHSVFASRSRFVAADALAAGAPTEAGRAPDADGPAVVDYFREALAEERPYFPSTLLLERSTFLHHGGYDPGVRRGEDMEFMTRVALREPLVGTLRVTAAYVRGDSPIKSKARTGRVASLDEVAPVLAEIERRVQAGEPGPSSVEVLDAYLRWRLHVRARHWARTGDVAGVLQLVRAAPRRHRGALVRFAIQAALPPGLRSRRKRLG